MPGMFQNEPEGVLPAHIQRQHPTSAAFPLRRAVSFRLDQFALIKEEAVMTSSAFDASSLLHGIEAAGGWIDRSLLTLDRFDQMGWGARALCDIPVSSSPFSWLAAYSSRQTRRFSIFLLNMC